MATRVPVYRSGASGGAELTLEPKDDFQAAVVVEMMSIGTDNVAVLRLYVARSTSSATATVRYSPNGKYCIVDLPRANEIDLDRIMEAIRKGDPNLPDPPVTWYHG